ncbi:MAG: pilus assembly protein FimV [Arenicella sp.]|jgi:pilus assembly protein FimV
MANRKTLISGFKLAAVGAVGLLTSANLAALGLGALDIQSNLNQPLNGVIEMRVATGDDISSIRAVIASKEEFEGLGIDYPGYFSDLTVVVEEVGNDSVLRVVSNDVVITEPFIHFLVRVDWTGGSFLREYMALIDPPVYAAESPQSIAQPKVVGTDQSYQFQDAQSKAEEVDQALIYDAEDQFEAERATKSLAPDTTATRGLESFPVDAQYGPVTSGESLSMIAAELQRQFPDLSIYQIMQVMFQENRDAFIRDNINGLRKGAVLNIGDLNEIRAIEIAQAKQFFFDQVSEWDPSFIAPSSPSSDAGLRVAKDQYDYFDDLSGDANSRSIAKTTIDNFQVGSSSDIIQAVSAAQGNSSESEVLALQLEITELQGSLSSSTLENRELSERVSILEGQISDMNRLVSMNVEDAELANLEATLADQNDAESLVQDGELVAGNEIDDVVTGEISSIDDLVSEYLSDETSEFAGGEEEDPLANDDELADEYAETDVESSEEQGLVSRIEDLSDENISETKTTPVVSAPRPSLFEKLKNTMFEGGLWKVLAGTGVVLLSGLILLLIRRRRADEEFEISMLSIETQSLSPSVATTVIGSKNKSPDRETSFLTVYSDSDAVVQASEVDPIAEADVYIAYGRDEQAEEVLLDGVASKPERVDIKQKLLGLYHKNNNVEGFERISEELYSQKNQLTSKVWQAVSLMGKDLAPENPLFDVSSAELLADELPETDLTSATPLIKGAETSGKSAETSGAADNDDGIYQIDQREIAPGVSLAEESSSINLVNFYDGRSEISELDDIEISDLDLGSGNLSDDDSFLNDADGSLNADGSVNADGSLNAEIYASIDINTESTDGDASLSDDEASATKSFEDSKAVEFEPVPSGSDQQTSQDMSDLEIDDDYDEAQTQYELAKVFVDLGDEDGARKILNDLVANDEISEDVMIVAQKLLKSL